MKMGLKELNGIAGKLSRTKSSSLMHFFIYKYNISDLGLPLLLK